MLRHAERAGFQHAGGTVIEATAGAVGLALAMATADLGYQLVVVMPQRHAGARCNLLRALGSQIVFTDAAAGIAGAIERAEHLAKTTPNSLMLQPFTNRANAQAHEQTAREIWEDTDGEVAAVVCPVGTGGTAAGCLAFFRDLGAPVPVFAVEPAASPVLAGGAAGPHDLPGLGAGFVPDILRAGDLAGILAVTEHDAFAAVRELAAREGILAGPAGGATCAAARELARRPAFADKLIVGILPDSGERFEEHAAFAGAEVRA
jgi:cysteine synthase A